MLLTGHRLIDEYQVVVWPAFLGRGRTLLGEMPEPLPLELLEARAFRSGNVLLRYAANAREQGGR